MSLLSVRGLSVHIGPVFAPDLAIQDVSFELDEGGSFGLVGESGCGKTTTAKALLGLLPRVMRVAAGSILFRGTDLLGLGRRELNQVRWRDISLVTQSAMNALDPVSRVGVQIVEAIRGHAVVPKRQAERRAEELFSEVGLDPAWTRRYPHEFSGGMRQRAIIAMALACDPALIIADEPTTALDVIVQDEVFDVLSRVRQVGRQALLLISHDLALVAENCERVAVMYAGRIVETGPSGAVFTQPSHPYTIGLQSAFPELGGEEQELISIPGSLPHGPQHSGGCMFADRCPFARPVCRRQAPALVEIGPGHFAACHFQSEMAAFRALGAKAATWEPVRASS
jgi:oligopeptide/dipeptide ABC transporter ATP-binding protein